MTFSCLTYHHISWHRSYLLSSADPRFSMHLIWNLRCASRIGTRLRVAFSGLALLNSNRIWICKYTERSYLSISDGAAHITPPYVFIQSYYSLELPHSTRQLKSCWFSRVWIIITLYSLFLSSSNNIVIKLHIQLPLIFTWSQHSMCEVDRDSIVTRLRPFSRLN